MMKDISMTTSDGWLFYQWVDNRLGWIELDFIQ